MSCFGKSYIIRISCEKIRKNKEEKCHTQVTCTRLKELPNGFLMSNNTSSCRCMESCINELASVIFKKHMLNGLL